MRYLILFSLLAAGCAAIQDNPCAAGGSYEAGRGDAMFGKPPSFDAYAQRCSRDAVASADYMAGWRIGYSETSFRQPN
jgi:hypothetical protein